MPFVAGHPAAELLAASDVVGFVLFGVFLVAFAILAVVTIAWAIRRDRAGRAEMAAQAAKHDIEEP